MPSSSEEGDDYLNLNPFFWAEEHHTLGIDMAMVSPLLSLERWEGEDYLRYTEG